MKFSGLKILYGVMNLEYKCLKCGSDKYIVKTAVIPEKSPGLKIEIGTYYIKTCVECGYTEFYSAKIVDKDFEKEKKEKKGSRFAKKTSKEVPV